MAQPNSARGVFIERRRSGLVRRPIDDRDRVRIVLRDRRDGEAVFHAAEDDDSSRWAVAHARRRPREIQRLNGRTDGRLPGRIGDRQVVRGGRWASHGSKLVPSGWATIPPSATGKLTPAAHVKGAGRSRDSRLSRTNALRAGRRAGGLAAKATEKLSGLAEVFPRTWLLQKGKSGLLKWTSFSSRSRGELVADQGGPAARCSGWWNCWPLPPLVGAGLRGQDPPLHRAELLRFVAATPATIRVPTHPAHA